MIPPLAQVHLLGRGTGPLSFRSSRLACGDTLFRLRSDACFARAAFASFHFTQSLAVWFPPQPQHWGCSRGVEHPPERWGPPHATHRVAYSQLRRVWPKPWQRLHCSGPLGATYDSIVTRKPQSSVSGRTFDTSGPRATDTMKLGVGGRSLAGCWSRRPDRSCVTPWTRMFRDSSSSRTTLSGIPLPRFFTRSRTQRSSGRVKVWKLTPSFPLTDRSALTEARIPSAVDGTTINFSLFIWAVRPPGQDACNQARKEWASLKPKIKLGVLLGRFPAGRQALATWAFEVVTSGLSLRPRHVARHAPVGCFGWDTRFGLVRIHGCGLEQPTWLRRGDGPDQYSHVRCPSPGWSGLPAADSSLFAHDLWIRGQRRGPTPRCWVPVGRLHRLAQAS